MTCPYCDESFQVAARFCPKCGLPQNDDPTLMGAYVTDDSGPNRWVLITGGAAILVVAISLGWMSTTRAPRAKETVRREPLARVPAPSFAPAASGLAPPLTQQLAPAPSQPTRWVYNPPPAPPPSFRIPEPDPEPPRVDLALLMLHRPKEAPSVSTPRPVTPETPPAVEDLVDRSPMGPLAAETASAETAGPQDALPPRTRLAFSTRRPGPGWEWDPVHERYVNYRSRRSGRVGRPGSSELRGWSMRGYQRDEE